jgi:hypothetical protein
MAQCQKPEPVGASSTTRGSTRSTGSATAPNSSSALVVTQGTGASPRHTAHAGERAVRCRSPVGGFGSSDVAVLQRHRGRNEHREHPQGEDGCSGSRRKEAGPGLHGRKRGSGVAR